MAGNTRGKLKEQFEGIHNNLDWSRRHVLAALDLVKDYKPRLAKAIQGLGKGIDTLDELAKDIYSQL